MCQCTFCSPAPSLTLLPTSLNLFQGTDLVSALITHKLGKLTHGNLSPNTKLLVISWLIFYFTKKRQSGKTNPSQCIQIPCIFNFQARYRCHVKKHCLKNYHNWSWHLIAMFIPKHWFRVFVWSKMKDFRFNFNPVIGLIVLNMFASRF